MNKYILSVFISLFLIPNTNAALRGGEITWQCLKQGTNKGKIIFTVRLYRTCDSTSASLPNSIALSNPLYATYGGVSSIVCGRRLVQDISPKCYDPSSQIKCGGSETLAYELNEYVSQPVAIYGVPATSGSSFAYSSSGRPTTLNTTGNGFYLRAVMYPYSDPYTGKTVSLGSTTVGSTCYDNSPTFTEDLSYIAEEYTHTYFSHHAYDLECDSLNYEFTSPMQNASTPVSWRSGYSVVAPLPSNTSNIPLILNRKTGSAQHLTFGNRGLYHMAYKITGYKHRQKVSEVFRDYAMVLDSAQSRNYNPQIMIKNSSDTGYSHQFYTDTFEVGDSIRLNIRAVDSLYFSPRAKQSVSIKILKHKAMGGVFNPYDCAFTSCATVDTLNPAWNGSAFVDSGEVEIDFNWDIKCEHLRRCGQIQDFDPNMEVYTFVVLATDNGCRLPSKAISRITIVVRGKTEIKAQIKDVSIIDTLVQIGFAKDTSANFSAYYVYKSASSSSPFTLLDSITNVNDTVYVDSTSNATLNYNYYRVVSFGDDACFIDENTVRPIVLHVSDTIDYNSVLEWNVPYQPRPFTSAGYYIIESDTGSGWFQLATLYGLNAHNYFLDTINTCNKAIEYRILVQDTVSYVSNIDSARYTFPKHYDSLVICNGDSVYLDGQFRFASGNFIEYYSYINGCDSTVFTQLVVNQVNNDVQSDGRTITADAKNARYQWIDCISNTLLPDTTDTLMPSTNGQYAVIVTQNGCVDTSECIEINTVGIKNLNQDFSLKVFPNPANENITFQLAQNDNEEEGILTVYDVLGNVYLTIETQLPYILNTQDMPEGLFYYNLVTKEDQNKYSGRFMVSHQ